MSELTLDVVNRALERGEVEYNLRGDVSAIDPIAARELLLRYASKDQKHEEIDLSLVFD